MRVILVTTLVTIMIGLAPSQEAEARPEPIAELPGGPEYTQELFRGRQWVAAVFVSTETGIPLPELLQAWQSAPEANQVAVIEAVSQVGKSYRYASWGPNSYDCSGLVGSAWREAGVDLPANSRRQINAVEPVEGQPMAGDLLYYPGHIMMSLGVGDHIVHAANRRTGVKFGEVSRSVRAGRPA